VCITVVVNVYSIQEQAAILADRQQEITTTLKPFFCQLCEKQFKNVTQYDEHTNSYAHHHKARAKDMQASLKPKADQASIVLRKEKERLREERAIRKMAKAAGVKIVGVPVSTAPQLQLLKIGTTLGKEPGQDVPSYRQNSSVWMKVGSTSMTVQIDLPPENTSPAPLPPPDNQQFPPPPPPPPE
jgi:uncharacterized C2H2 Zn-finger protein